MISPVNMFSTYSILTDYSNYQLRSNLINFNPSNKTNSSTSVSNSFDFNYLDSFKSQISDLQTKSDQLMTSNIDSAINQRNVSINTDNLTAEVESGATLANYSININQLAKGQINQSSKLDSDAYAVDSGFTEGDNTFQITQDGQKTELTVNIKSYDTNLDVLNKIEEKVNTNMDNITSKVTKNNDGTSQLQLKSTTGQVNSFSISDVNSNLIAQSSLNTTTQQAQDANYEVNNESFTSPNNVVNLDNNNLQLTFQETGTAQVEVSPDTENIVSAVESFAQEFNETSSFLKTDMTKTESLELAEFLEGKAEEHELNLQEIGININEQGVLKVDQDQLVNSLQENPEKVENTLGSSSGFAAEINNKTDDILTKPLTPYAVSNNQFNLNIYDQTGQISSLLTSGMLLDYQI